MTIQDLKKEKDKDTVYSILESNYKLLTELMRLNDLFTSGNTEVVLLEEYLLDYKVLSLSIGDNSLFRTILLLEYAKRNPDRRILFITKPDYGLIQVSLDRIKNSFDLTKPDNLDIISYETANTVTKEATRNYSAIFMDSPTLYLQSNLEVFLEKIISRYATSKEQHFIILGY